MMNRCGCCLAILPLISTSDPNITAQLFIIAVKMNYGTNIRVIQFSPKSIFHSLLSVKGTWQTRGIGLLSICIPKVNHLVTLCFSKPISATLLISLIKKWLCWNGTTQWGGRGGKKQKAYDNSGWPNTMLATDSPEEKSMCKWGKHHNQSDRYGFKSNLCMTWSRDTLVCQSE